MKRRAPRPKNSGHSAPGDHSANHCRALVLVDGTAIRKKIKRDYQKALRDLDNSRRQLDQFRQTDLPQFTRWLNVHFGALLTEIRELSQKIALDEELIFDVHNEVLFGGCSYPYAYERVMALRENPTAATGEPDEEPIRLPRDQNPEILTTRRRIRWKHSSSDYFGQFGPGERPREKHASRPGHRGAPGSLPDSASRLKELYRSLVRRLHPDTQREMTAQKSEWWHQAQTAYEAGDLDQLEVILTLCEIDDSGTTAHTSASLLQRITAQLKSSLREIKRQLARHRRDPAWNFSQRTDHDLMAVQMRRELTGDLQQMRERWRQTQEMIATWKAAPARPKAAPRRKQRPPHGGRMR